MRMIYKRALSLVFICVGMMLVIHSGVMAQQHTSLSSAIKKVSRTFGTHFLYDKALLENKSTSYKINNIQKNQKVEDVLKNILYPEGLVFIYIKENYYTIMSRDQSRKAAQGAGHFNSSDNGASSRSSPDNARNSTSKATTPDAAFTGAGGVGSPAKYTLHGIVTDSLGTPIEGVSVQAKNTKKGIATSGDGRFSLDIKAPQTLVFSCIGYQSKEVEILGENNITVVLSINNAELSKVVVIGYGTQRKIDMTGAVATIDAGEIAEDHASVNVTDMLAGRIPGLFAIKTGGGPGDGSNLYVRGVGTTNNSSPLIVVDGIPDRSLDNINPSDIQSISVLKDAASIAIYGARAANGVILVTTKKGQNGAPKINFSMNLINQRPTQVYKTLNSFEYATLYNEALKNEDSYQPDLGVGYSEQELQKFKDGSDPDHYPNTDWVKEVLASSVWQSSYNVSASGGSKSTQYFLSAGYAKNNGLFPVEGYKRYNLRSNITTEIGKNLKLQLDLAGIFSKSHDEGVFGSEYIIRQVYNTPPIRVNRFSNGSYAFVPEQRGNAYQQSLANSGFWNSDNNIINSNLSMEYSIPGVKGLSVKGTMSYDKTMGFQKRFATPYEMYSIDDNDEYYPVSAYPTAPYLREYYAQRWQLTYEGSIHYDRHFDRHHIGALLLYSQTEIKSDNFNTQRSNFVSDALPELSLGDPTQVTNDGGGTQSARRGLVGRLTYDYGNKYLAEFNFRYDGSDIFPPNHRYGFFPSISAGWVISQESFFKNAGTPVNFLKLRGSWGQLGNDRVDPYQFLSTYSLSGGYSFGGPAPTYYQALQENVLPNPNFTWERAEMTDIGLEAQLWQNLLGIEVDYYRKRTKDILIPPAAQVPSVIGISLPSQNNGIVDNSGWDISLTHRNHIGKFNYYISPNISITHNKVIEFPESSSIPAWQRMVGNPVPFSGGAVISPESRSYYVIGYHALGLYQSEEEIENGPTPPYPNVKPGDIRYADTNGDGKITADDQVVMNAHFFPPVQYGIKLGGSYEGIELNILFQGAAGVDAYTYLISNENNKIALDRWTPEHTNASYPRLWYNNQNNTENSDYWVKNTSYMRLKNIEVAYQLPQALLRRYGVDQLRVALGANNLLTFTKFKEFDPESAGQVRDPLMKSYTLSVQLNF